MQRFLLLVMFFIVTMVAGEVGASPLQSQYGAVGGSVDSNANLGGALVPYAQSQIASSVTCVSGAITASSITLIDGVGFDPTGGTASLEDNTGHANNFTYTDIASNVMHNIVNVGNGQLKTCVGTYNTAGSRVYASTSATAYANRLNTTNTAIRRTQSIVGMGKVSFSTLGAVTLSAAVSAIGAAQAELVVDGLVSYGAGVTVPPTLTLSFTPLGLIDCGSTALAVTIQGNIKAGPRAIFANCPAGSVLISNNTQGITTYPQWWGAPGGGVGDAGAALAANVAALTGGGMITLTDNFRIVTPWVFSNVHNITVQGQPGGQITQASINNYGIQIRNASSHITLQDFIVDGPHTHGDTINTRDGVIVGDESTNDGATTKSDITIRRLNVSGFTHGCVSLIALNNGGIPSANANIRILENTLVDCQNGIFIYKGATHIQVNKNFIQDTWFDGIAVDTDSAPDAAIGNPSVEINDISITDNTIDGVGIDGQAVGILLKGLVTDAKVQHNVIHNVGINQISALKASFGIFTEADAFDSVGRNHTITNNAIDNIVSLSGSALGMSINDTIGTTVSGNTISNILNSVGIDVNQVDTIAITGNTLYAVGGCGIPMIRLTRQTMTGATLNASVTGNVLVDHRGDNIANDCSTVPLSKTTLGVQVDWADGVHLTGNRTTLGITQGVGFTANALNYMSSANTSDVLSTLIPSPLATLGASAAGQNVTMQFKSAGTTVGRWLYAGVNGAGNKYIGVLADNGVDGFRIFTQDNAASAMERMRMTGGALVANTIFSSANVSISPASTIITPTAALQVNGGIRIATTATRPTCDSTLEGTTWVTVHSAGVATIRAMCVADNAAVFSWLVY